VGRPKHALPVAPHIEDTDDEDAQTDRNAHRDREESPGEADDVDLATKFWFRTRIVTV
jgi:hypothetical protein